MYFNESFNEIIQLQQNLMNQSSPSINNEVSKKLIQNIKIAVLLSIIVIGVIGNIIHLN